MKADNAEVFAKVGTPADAHVSAAQGKEGTEFGAPGVAQQRERLAVAAAGDDEDVNVDVEAAKEGGRGQELGAEGGAADRRAV